MGSKGVKAEDPVILNFKDVYKIALPGQKISGKVILDVIAPVYAQSL